MATNTTITIRVKDGNGAYTTNQVQGKRASSTSSYGAAAEALARKLYPDTDWALKPGKHEPGVQEYELELI